MGKKICLNCNKVHSENARFCVKCGSALQTVEYPQKDEKIIEQIVCPRCNQVLSYNVRFCPNCGSSLDNTKVLDNQKKSNKKLKIIIPIIAFVLIASIIISAIIVVSNNNEVVIDGKGKVLLGEEYYIPKTMNNIYGEAEKNHNYSLDKNSDDYYIKTIVDNEGSDYKFISAEFDANGYLSYIKTSKKEYKINIDDDGVLRSINGEKLKYDKKDRMTEGIYDGGLKMINGKFQESDSRISYDDDDRIIKVKRTYKDKDRIIEEVEEEREYLENNKFRIGECEYQYDEHFHLTKEVNEDGTVSNYYYKYDDNGCITEYKHEGFTKKCTYQKVNKQEYVNYWCVCKCVGGYANFMPVDCVHSSMFICFNPWQLYTFYSLHL